MNLLPLSPNIHSQLKTTRHLPQTSPKLFLIRTAMTVVLLPEWWAGPGPQLTCCISSVSHHWPLCAPQHIFSTDTSPRHAGSSSSPWLRHKERPLPLFTSAYALWMHATSCGLRQQLSVNFYVLSDICPNSYVHIQRANPTFHRTQDILNWSCSV